MNTKHKDFFGQTLEIGSWAVWGTASSFVQGQIIQLSLHEKLDIAKIRTRERLPNGQMYKKFCGGRLGKSLIQIDEPLKSWPTGGGGLRDYQHSHLVLDTPYIYLLSSGQLALVKLVELTPKIVAWKLNTPNPKTNLESINYSFEIKNPQRLLSLASGPLFSRFIQTQFKD